MKRIMIVDDDEHIREVLRALLKKEGYDVIETDSGIKCLELLKEGKKPDLILLDVMMPKFDGWETCKKIKENTETKDITVAMLTVKDQTEEKVKSLEYATADWHISKPIIKHKLIDTVEWLLSKK
jgi:two-component system alkaline phosphatase synthesis response regulator PhoP